MGLLDIFSKQDAPKLAKLPSGSFTVDADANILTSTLPHGFPQRLQQKIAQEVLVALREGNQGGFPFTEIIIHFSAMKITARSLRGGAIIFLAPQTFKRT